ncbi:MAG: anti-sigma-factor antagonist [Acidobacteriaceae bacterium]|nr:anti-sigma-factor antagonist [Acidobacteriaceae bacterium]
MGDLMGQPANNSAKVIILEGAMRAGTAVDSFRLKVEEGIRSGQPHIVVEMSKVTSLDSSGIGVLVRSLTQVKQQGGSLKLVAVPHAASQTLKITGVLRLFEVFPKLDDALNSVVT